MIEKTLKELGFSEKTISVYKKLMELRGAFARQLAENIGMTRPSVYDHLKLLSEQGLIVQKDEDGKNFYQISDTAQLKKLIKDKIEALQIESKNIDRYLPDMDYKIVEPKIRHFKGKDQVSKILNDLYWYENTEILSIWPMKEIIEILGVDYLENFNRKRIKNRNPLRIIWPKDKVVDIDNYPFLGTGKGHLRSVRIGPMDITWNMGHLIYEDKVAFISSRKESFGFIVQSRDFAELMRVQFELIWSISKPLKYTPPKEDSFLKTI
jgi:sugar-specific transcriptional regulator TrmB